MNQKEIWKPIFGYEGYYEISNMGRVRSLDRFVPFKNGGGKSIKGKILRLGKMKDGYLNVGLMKDGKSVNHKVHRLVAKHFIPNPNGYKIVNHKDFNVENNHADNLEWCTSRYNATYSCGRETLQIDLDGNVIRKWESTKEVKRVLGWDVARCCRKETNLYTVRGYIWIYKDEAVLINGKLNAEELAKRTVGREKPKKVGCFDMGWNLVKEYASIQQVRKDGFRPTAVSVCCNHPSSKYLTHKGYRWKFLDDSQLTDKNK